MTRRADTPGGLFRRLRIGALLFVLLAVALDAGLTRARTTDWDQSLWVAVYPINADASDTTRRYITSLSNESLGPVTEFFGREATRYGVAVREPFHVRLGAEIHNRPPPPPLNGHTFDVMAWSLKLRYWSWRVQRAQPGPPVNIQIFVQFFDPAQTRQVAHSLGLQKGLVGVVNAFAENRATETNNIVIAHELLHTVGATDKYDPATNQPIFPDGYADLERTPRYPQARAEIMAGRIPSSDLESAMPKSLANVVVGPQTALEIGWRRR